MKQTNILVTGGAGFIGSNLVKQIEIEYPYANIFVFDKFNNGAKRSNQHFEFYGDYRNLINFKGCVIPGDLQSESDVNKLLARKFDIIFHQAAISDTTVTDQNEVLNTNTHSFLYFLEYVKQNNCKLIYASSAGVYGNSKSPNGIGEGEIPENIYGFSKLSMDNLVRSFLRQNPSAHVVGLRYFNVYGPGEIYKRRTSSMILQLYKQYLDKGKVRLFKYGEQTRDFVYIKDVINANIKAIDGLSGIYNVGSGVSRSFNDIVSILEKNLETKIDIEYFENPYSFYQNNTCADLSTSHTGLNFYPAFSLEDGIADYTKEIVSYTQNDWKYFYE